MKHWKAQVTHSRGKASYLVISEDLLPFLWVPLCVFPRGRKINYYFAKIVTSTHAIKNYGLSL